MAVAVCKSKPNDERLVAYIECDPKHVPETFYLRSFLQQYLPEYMIPSRFVILEMLPLTINGKIDKKALPNPLTTTELEEKPRGLAEKREERVCQWQVAFESVYRETELSKNPNLNITGWTNSYTGKLIPEGEMHDWVFRTVAQIHELSPKRVLELGCGTGMLLFRIAPCCNLYYGLDFSKNAVNFVKQQLQTSNINLPFVNVFHRPADNFSDLIDEPVDTVIINSVAQFFADIHYLDDVISKAAEHVSPGGYVFIGDVRSLSLLEVFHTSVQLFQAADHLTIQQLNHRINRHIRLEKELVVDQNFFRTLPKRNSKIAHVEIRLKRGCYENEMTCFRYDVLAFVGPRQYSKKSPYTIDWQDKEFSLSTCSDFLVNLKLDLIYLKNIPNSRIQK